MNTMEEPNANIDGTNPNLQEVQSLTTPVENSPFTESVPQPQPTNQVPVEPIARNTWEIPTTSGSQISPQISSTPAPQPLPQPQPVVWQSAQTPQPSLTAQPEAPVGTVPTTQQEPIQQNSWQPGGGLPPQPVLSYNSTPHSNKKKLFIGIGSALALLLIVSGFVFGYYIPNKPANVWSTGLKRSGKAVDKLVVQLTDKKKIDTFKKSEIAAKGDVTYGKETYSGNFTTKFDESKLDGNIEFTFPGEGGAKQTVAIKALAQTQKDSLIPDTYVQLTGLKAMGADSFSPGASDYDGRWISITRDYLKSVGVKEEDFAGKSNQDKFNNEDGVEIVKAVTDTTNEYLFTTDSSKSILINKAFVGKEQSEGIKAFHYRAGIDKAHAKDYCRALFKNVQNTKAYKKIVKDDKAASASSNSDCNTDDIKDSDTLDVWIDAKYKLIHKIRAYDDTDKKSYFEFGQIYKGGDDISLFSNYHGDTDKYDVKFKIDTNLKTVSSKGLLTIAGGEGDSKIDAKITLEAKPLTTDIKLDIPKDAVPIKDVFQKFGIDPAALAELAGAAGSTYGGAQNKAKDSERQVDINSLQSQ